MTVRKCESCDNRHCVENKSIGAMGFDDPCDSCCKYDKCLETYEETNKQDCCSKNCKWESK